MKPEDITKSLFMKDKSATQRLNKSSEKLLQDQERLNKTLDEILKIMNNLKV